MTVERPHPSDRILDAVVILFALWTVSSHGVVAAGGTLADLLAVFGVVLTLASVVAFAFLRSRRRVQPRRDEPAPARDGVAVKRLRLAGVAVGALLVAYSSFAPGILTLWTGVALALLLAAAVLLAIEDRDRPLVVEGAAGGFAAEAVLWTAAVLAVAVTLLAHRYDPDDSIYVNLAVTAADRPFAWPLLSGDTLHGIPGLPIHFSPYRLHSYELANAVLCLVTGLPAIACFHWVSASLAAFLVPLAHGRLARLLTPRIWPWTLTSVLVVLVAVGETHRWYGNFAFVRMWQGKSVYLSVMVPLLCVYAMRYALAPSWGRWWLLLGAQVASIGLTSSALAYAPITVATALAAASRPGRRGLVRLAVGLLSSGYSVAAGLLFKGKLEGSIRRMAQPDLGARPAEALVTVLGDGRVWLMALAAILVAWTVPRTALGRRFALAFPFVTWVLLLNPFLDRLVVAHVTGAAYWRGLWVLPLPFLMALVLTAPLRLDGAWRRWAGRAGWFLALAAFTVLVPRYGGLSRRNRVVMKFPPELKVSSSYATAEELQRLSGPGAHVAAPNQVGLWIPTFRRPAYPLSVRHYLAALRRYVGIEEWRERERITRYVAGEAESPEAGEAFRDGLDRFQVTGVCLRSRGNDARGEARRVLAEHGFRRMESGKGFEIWIRPRRGPDAPVAQDLDGGEEGP